MQVVKGKLVRLGEAEHHWGWRYEIIEVGDHVLRGVRAPRLIIPADANTRGAELRG